MSANKHCGSEDMMFLIFHVISQDVTLQVEVPKGKSPTCQVWRP